MTRTVTRSDLVRAVRLVSPPGLSNDEMAALVNATLDQVADALVAGSAVKVSRFGRFAPHDAPARTVRNPSRPAEEHAIAPRTRVSFRASLKLRHGIATGVRE